VPSGQIVGDSLEVDAFESKHRVHDRPNLGRPAIQIDRANYRMFWLECKLLERRMRPRELLGLGLVRLDAFVVSKKDGLPSNGYWRAAHHDREVWERVLGNAGLLD